MYYIGLHDSSFLLYQQSCSASVDDSSREHSREQKFKSLSIVSSALSLKELFDTHNLSFVVP